MSEAQEVLKVAIKAGEKIFVHAKGDPATVLACGAAGAAVVIATTIGYGSYYYGNKFLDWMRSI